MWAIPSCPPVIGRDTLGFVPDEVLIEADDRNRVTLGRLAGEYKRFLASVDDEGTITLKPAVVRSVIEDRLLSDPSIAEAVRSSRDPQRRVRDRKVRRSAKKA